MTSFEDGTGCRSEPEERAAVPPAAASAYPMHAPWGTERWGTCYKLDYCNFDENCEFYLNCIVLKEECDEQQ